jgi:hypothetical protein
MDWTFKATAGRFGPALLDFAIQQSQHTSARCIGKSPVPEKQQILTRLGQAEEEAFVTTANYWRSVPGDRLAAHRITSISQIALQPCPPQSPSLPLPRCPHTTQSTTLRPPPAACRAQTPPPPLHFSRAQWPSCCMPHCHAVHCHGWMRPAPAARIRCREPTHTRMTVGGQKNVSYAEPEGTMMPCLRRRCDKEAGISLLRLRRKCDEIGEHERATSSRLAP